jgi:hypothetical protein
VVVTPSSDVVDVMRDCSTRREPPMTLAHALPAEPASPQTPDRVRPETESDIHSYPEVLGALASRWSRMSALPTSTWPSVETDDAVCGQDWDLVDEWGLQSFPASDPPSNW